MESLCLDPEISICITLEIEIEEEKIKHDRFQKEIRREEKRFMMTKEFLPKTREINLKL